MKVIIVSIPRVVIIVKFDAVNSLKKKKKKMKQAPHHWKVVQYHPDVNSSAWTTG